MSLAFLLVACGDTGEDERTAQITPGMDRAAVLGVLRSPLDGQQPPAGDSLANVWRQAQYFMQGKMIDVIWYSSNGEARTPADTVPEKAVVPIVLVDGKVVGVGRAAHDSVATAMGLPKDKY